MTRTAGAAPNHAGSPASPSPGDGRAGAKWSSAFGAATLVSVGYMDPGNWATDLEGGARFGYALLWVLVASNAVAILLQALCARLGVVSGNDLAAACRAHYPRPLAFALWAFAEVGIVACDVAEILGSAIGLNLLFGLPLVWGALVTVGDVLLILAFERLGVRTLEAVVLALVTTIAVCLAVDVVMARPSPGAALSGLLPRIHGGSLYVAVGILGATVMPHNLYLHSALARRDHRPNETSRARSLRKNLLGTVVALNLALLVNAAILLLAAAVFARRGIVVTDLRDACRLLSPALGTVAGSVLFAVGLLSSGQSASLTGTLAGQIVMEGMLRVRVPPAFRRLLTRCVAVVPALAVLGAAGERGTLPLLVASQVVLSLQLPFAVIPLVRFTSSPKIMGPCASGRVLRGLAVSAAALVVVANTMLVVTFVARTARTAPARAFAVAALAVAVDAVLGYAACVPLRSRRAGFVARGSRFSETPRGGRAADAP
jgi:manganese transport protein